MLRVYPYIERNPVRAGIVRTQEEHEWTSVHFNLGLRFDSLITSHQCLLALGQDPESRPAAYREWLLDGEDETELQSIRSHMVQQCAYGDERFQAMVEKTLERPAMVRP